MKFQLALGLVVFLVIGAAHGEETAEVSETSTCTPGQSFTIGCNSCVCPDSGKKLGSACTLSACPQQGSPSSTEAPEMKAEDKCQPGSTFHTDPCNQCVCPENGQKVGAACTLIACSDKKE